MVCKVKFSNEIITIPSRSVDVDFYTSKKCPDCKSIESKLRKYNRQLNNLFNIKVIDVEKAPTPNYVLYIPTIDIQKRTIIGDSFDKSVLLKKASQSSV